MKPRTQSRIAMISPLFSRSGETRDILLFPKIVWVERRITV